MGRKKGDTAPKDSAESPRCAGCGDVIAPSQDFAAFGPESIPATPEPRRYHTACIPDAFRRYA